MNMMENALRIAVKEHAGQVDKGGIPYILHPLAVMCRVRTYDEKIVAVLHDVVEDTDVTITRLELEGFTQKIIDGVDAMTHRPNEPNVEYWNRVKQNEIARNVKIADIRHNIAPERMACLDKETRDRLAKKYDNAIAVLMD